VSRLRAKCPFCRTLTAVAIGEGYECHSCGREFGAGLVRVPRAWGKGGEAMVAAARLPLPYPEVAVIEEPSLAEQNLALAAELPARPLVLGGCCCSHVGAVEGIAARHDRLAIVWLDAHGDLNTPETSPTGNEWGMPLRMLIDSGAVDADDVVLVGARELDPPEEEFIGASGVHTGEEGIDAALEGVDAVYVALDVDVLRPGGEVEPFMPEEGGPDEERVAAIVSRVVAARPLAGAGLTGLSDAPANAEAVARFTRALGL
jgi:arginase family enzyme